MLLTHSTDTFTYETGTWEDRLVSYNGQSIVYDNIGNPTTYLGATLTWRGRELANYTKDATSIDYSYDVDGMRYQKLVKTSGSETARYNYVYADGQLILLSYTANSVTQNAKFIYDSAGEVRGFVVDGATEYLYLKNTQGGIVAVISETGVPVVRYTYDAWGNATITTDSGYENLVNLSPFAYRGYCYDNDIKMYYLQSRYYDPQICRFINADSSEYLGATGTVLSCNLFAYCENDPVNNKDTYGTYSCPDSLKIDWAGKSILKHYLTGKGKKKTYNSNLWTKYMNNAPICKSYGCGHKVARENTLSQYIVNQVMKYQNKVKNAGITYSKTLTVKIQLQNGESIYGYNYLHGVNSKVGGLKIKFKLSLINSESDKKKYTYKIVADCEWHDIIDPNPKYESDIKKAKIANVISFGQAKDYEICIKWQLNTKWAVKR